MLGRKMRPMLRTHAPMSRDLSRDTNFDNFNVHLFYILIYNRRKRKNRFIIYKFYYRRENIIIITIFLLFESSNNLTCFITNNFFFKISFYDINSTIFKDTSL